MKSTQIPSEPPANDGEVRRTGDSAPPPAVLASPAYQIAAERHVAALHDLIPMAKLFGTAGQGAIVLNRKKKVVFMNTVAARFLDVESDSTVDVIDLGWILKTMSACDTIRYRFERRGLVLGEETKVKSLSDIETDCLVTLQTYHDASGDAYAYLLLMVENVLSAKRARTDPLTGLANRGEFDTRFPYEYERLMRGDGSLSLLFLDIDHFGRFNKQHGAQVGDQVLRDFGRILAEAVRTVDIPCRYGGEEFAIILPDTDSEGAVILAERIRQVVEEFVVEIDGKSLRITASIGVATHRSSDKKNPSALLRTADAEMQRAKRDGRNRVSVPDIGRSIPAKAG